MADRKLIEIQRAQPTRDGDGVAISRIAGMQHAGMDPILMIDELRSENRDDFIGGFPLHPHRGMQTLTYMKNGGIIHEDSQGNRGEIRGGGAQWMSAGRGVIHSEMPTKDTEGLHGFQIWINLAAAEKMAQPDYRDVSMAQLSHLDTEGFTATAISGAWDFGADGSVEGPLDKLGERAAMADVALRPGAELAVQTAASDNVIAYVYGGSVTIDGRTVNRGELFITVAGERLPLVADEDGASLLVFSGQPLREPVAHYGPFVMNTAEEIEQAIRDYQAGRFAA